MIVQNNIFRLNGCTTARYGVFAWEQQTHSGNVSSDWITFSFRFVFADRLTEKQDNRTEVQSNGISTLTNIVRKLYELGLGVSSYSVQPFNQKFNDETAGAYMTVSINVPVDNTCGEAYRYYDAELGDFNIDYNDDFAIYSWIHEDKKVPVL